MLVSEIIILLILIGMLCIMTKYFTGKLRELRRQETGLKEYYEVVSRLLVLMNEGRDISDYFRFYRLKRVAIYGAGPLGELLYQKLRESEIDVIYVVDQRKTAFETVKDVKIIPPAFIKEQEHVDAIIITPLLHQKAILDILCGLKLPADTIFPIMDEVVNYLYHQGENNEIIS